MDDDHNDLIETWRGIIQGDGKSWVLFEHGTCVVLMQRGADLAVQATALLAEWGPVQVGTDSADFNLIELENGSGWVVTCYHPDILVFVPSDEENTSDTDEMVIGLIGRSIRGQDAEELKVIHVEDKRPPGAGGNGVGSQQ
jgi:hypothetical protein